MQVCVCRCERETVKEDRNKVFILHVCVWSDISLGIKTAPRNCFSPGCQKRAQTLTRIHSRCIFFVLTHRGLKVSVRVCACVCLKVWPLIATMSLKRSSSNQSTAANIRGKLKSRNRHSDREDSMRHRQSELTEKRRAAQTATHSRDRN